MIINIRYRHDVLTEYGGDILVKRSHNRKIRIIIAAAVLGAAQAVCIQAAAPAGLPEGLRDTPRKADAGMLQNEWRDRQRTLTVPEASKDVKVQTPEQGTSPAVEGKEVTVPVREFKITGQDIYSEQTLQALLADNKGKDLTFAQLQGGADVLTKYFRDHGYIVARAYLPQQQIDQGIVTYVVQVGRIDGVTVENHTKINDAAIQRQIGFLKKGDYVTRAGLERAVWLLSDLADADAKVTLSQGSEPGTVHVLLDVDPYKTKHGLATADNYGSRSMGYNQYGVNYDFTNLAHEGDHLNTGIATSGRKMFDWGANYTIPVLTDGLRMTVGYNVMSYDLGDEFSYLDGVGQSRVASIGFDYAIQRSRMHNFYAGIGYEHSRMKDEYRLWDATYGDKTGNAAVFSLYGDSQDNEGFTNWRVDYKWGHITNDALYNSSNPFIPLLANSPRTTGIYEKMRGYIERHQNINSRLYLLLTARGQYAFSNLDSSEHFYLGGPYGVRAYPTSEASGDTGYLTRAELRWQLPLKKNDQQLQLAAYLEHGGIWINKDSSLNPGAKNHRNLQGIGLGLIWSRHEDWFVRADYAWKLGSEEPVSDTRHSNGQCWLRTGVYF